MKLITMIKRRWLLFQIRQLDFDDAQTNKLVVEAQCDFFTMDMQAAHKRKQNMRDRLRLQNKIVELDAKSVLKEVSQ